MKQNPFSLYDFLGYVIPGALALILIGFFHNQDTLSSVTEGYNSALLFFGGKSGRGTMTLIEETVVFIVFSYVIGHIVAYLSSLTVEKFCIYSYGYPSKFLLSELPEWNYWKKNDVSVWKELKNEWPSLVWRILIGLFLYPISLCSIVIGWWLRVNSFIVSPLDVLLKNAITNNKDKLANSLNINLDEDGDFHRVIYHLEYERQSNHRLKMDNYVALYGFLRAMAFIANCVTLWVTYKFIWPTLALWTPFNTKLLIVWLMCVGVTYVFFLAFIKFYRRFTLECLMCLVIDNTYKEIPQISYTPSPSQNAENTTSATIQRESRDNATITETY